MRVAWEKIRRPASTVRRGRVPEIPVEIYHDLDNITRRLDGLSRLLGVTPEAMNIAASTSFSPLKAEVVGQQAKTETYIAEQQAAYTLEPDLTGGDYGGSTIAVFSKYPMIVSLIAISWRASTGYTRAINFSLFFGDENILTSSPTTTKPIAAEGAPSSDNWYFSQLTANAINGHVVAKQLLLPSGANTKGRMFPARTPMRATAAYPSFSLQVQVQIFGTHLVEVTSRT